MPTASIQFTLFRITVHPSRKEPLLYTKNPPAEVLASIIQSHPVQVHGRPSRWHIGNLKVVDGTAFYFRFGRVGKQSIPQTDAKGDFVDSDLPVAPYAHVFIDVGREVCAIAKNAKLSPKVVSIGRSLATFITRSSAARQLYVEIEVSPIKDPHEFLEKLRSAYSVRRFWVVTHRPNPFDADEDFSKPVARTIEGMGADEARTEWIGEGLNVEQPQVEEIVKSTAASGGDGGAIIRPSEQSKLKRISMTWDAGTFALEWGEDDVVRVNAVKILRNLYDSIRGKSGSE